MKMEMFVMPWVGKQYFGGVDTLFFEQFSSYQLTNLVGVGVEAVVSFSWWSSVQITPFPKGSGSDKLSSAKM